MLTRSAQSKTQWLHFPAHFSLSSFQFLLKMASWRSERPISQRSSQGCSRNSVSVWLNTDYLLTLEGWILSPLFSFVWCTGLSMFRKFLKPLYLCSAKLQTRCDICCACQSVCPFIPTGSNVLKEVDPQKSLQSKTTHGCQLGQPMPDSTFCSRFIESVRMMACPASRWEASHCIACVTAFTSVARVEVVTLWAPLSSFTVLPPCLTVNHQPDWSLVTEPSM